MEVALQKIEWMSLKPYIEEFTNHRIVFKFPKDNTPKFTMDVIKSLKETFSSITIDTPLEDFELTSDHLLITTHNWTFVTLEFRTPLKLRKYKEFLKLNKLD